MEITKKLSGVLTGLLVAATIFGFVALPSAQALTQSEASAIIAALGLSGSQAAAINALVDGPAPSASCDTYGTSSIVRVGNRGANVEAIQMAMNQILEISGGSMAPLAVDGIFGPLTRGVVQYFQGIIDTPADGIWGPNTQAAYQTYVANNCTTTPTGPVVPVGGWSVSAAASSPMASSLVAGQASAKLLDLNFTGNGNVTSVKLMRSGVSSNSVLSNVYLFDGANRLTDAASINNTGEITFNLPSGLFSVNGSKTISVRADVSSTASAGQTVGVNFVEAMSGTSMIPGSANGALMTVAVVSDLAAISFNTVTPNGAILQPGANVNVWQSTATISNHDVYLDRIAFRQIGSAQASAFANFKLYVNGVEVAQAAGLDANGYVTFVPASPVMMQAGSRIIRVDADIVSGSSRTVHFSLRNAADASFRDVQYNVNGSITGSNISAASASTISGATGGSMTVIKDIASPSANIGVDATDVSLGHFKLTAYGEPIKVETLTAGFSTTGGSTSLRNGRLLIDGVPYGSQASLVNSGTSFSVNKVINPGQSVIVDVRADVYASAGTAVAASDVITATLVAGSSNAQKMESLGVLNIPGSSVSANGLTVASATAGLAQTSTYQNQSVSLPQAAYKLGSWALTGSSIEDILVTTMTATLASGTGTTFDSSDVTNLTLKVNGADVQAPLAQAAASNNFASQFNLAKNSSATVELWGNLSNASATNGDSIVSTLALTGNSQPSGTSVSVSAVTGQTITAAAGTITATLDSSSPVAGIVHDNQTVTSAAFKFDAVNSSYNVSDMTFTIANAGSVSSVDLYDGATLVASKPGATTVTFNGLTSFSVPANMNKVLTVKLQLASAAYPATSGVSILTTLTSFTAVSSAGVSSVSAPAGPGVVAIEADPAGNGMNVYAAVPKFETVALTDATLLNTANRPLMRFRVTAQGGPIAWSQFHFDGSKDGATTVSNPTLWDVTDNANNQVVGAMTNVGMDTAASTSGSIDFNATAEQQVSSYKEYELRGTIAGANASGDFVTMTLANDSAAVVSLATSGAIETADADAPVIWSDMSAQSHSLTTADWTSDYGIKNLPISGSLNFN